VLKLTPQEMIDQLDVYGYKKISDVVKLQFINDAYYEVTSREPWTFMTKTNTVSTSNGVNTVTLPTDFSKVRSIVDTTNGNPLIPERADTINKRFVGALTSGNVPKYYYFEGNTIRLFPVPNGVFSLTVQYVAAPTALIQGGTEASILVPPRHHRLLVVGALERLAKLESEWDAAQAHRAEFDLRLEEARQDFTTQQYDRPDYIDVVDPADWDYGTDVPEIVVE
jgi:hypothetical protein